MAKKRLRIKDSAGNPVDYDVAASSVTLENGTDVETKINELGTGNYNKPNSGIPKTDLEQNVQDSLDKADSAIQGVLVNGKEVTPNQTTKKVGLNIPSQVQTDWEVSDNESPAFIKNKPNFVSQVFYEASTGKVWVESKGRVTELVDLNSLFSSVSYNSQNNIISFLNKRGIVVATLNASPFVVDGFVDSVELDNTDLVITFNTASGKSPIRVSLSSLGGQGTVQSVKMNGGSPIQPVDGVIDLGTVITSHQDISGKADKSEMSVVQGTGANADKTTITLKNGTSAQVINQHQSLANYPTKSEMNTAIQQSAGQDGKSAYQVAVDNGFQGSAAEWLASLKGNDGVSDGDEVVVVNNYEGVPDNLEEGQKAVLGAGLGTSIGKVFNVNTNDTNNSEPYSLWVGTAEELEAIKDNDELDENTIYLVGTIPTPATRYSLTKTLTNCSVSTETGVKNNQVTDGKSYVLVLSPNTGYNTIAAADVAVTMGGDVQSGVYNASTKTITIQEVTGAISITATATAVLESITVTNSGVGNNQIVFTAVVNPSAASSTGATWSINNTSDFEIASQNGLTCTVNVKTSASNASVTATCSIGNISDTDTVSGVTYTTSPAQTISSVSASHGSNPNTMELSAVADGSVTFALGSNVPKVNEVHRTIEEVDGEMVTTAHELVEVPAVTLNGNILTFKSDCDVEVIASGATGVTQSATIECSHASTDQIWFEDVETLKAVIGKSIGAATGSVFTRTDDPTYVGCVTYAQAAIPTKLDFTNKTAIIRFGEFKWFTSIAEISPRTAAVSLATCSFNGSTSLEYIDFPPSIRTVGYVYGNTSSFSGTKISDIDLHQVTTVAQYAFANLTNLKKAKINHISSSSTIGEYVFYNDTALEEVELGADITALATGFLRGCTGLKRLFIKNSTAVVTASSGTNGSINGMGSSEGFYIIVDDELVDDYKAATGWSTYKDNIIGETDYSALPTYDSGNTQEGGQS